MVTRLLFVSDHSTQEMNKTNVLFKHCITCWYSSQGETPAQTPQTGGPPLLGCSPLFIQYIRRYTPYVEAFSSIRYLRPHHAEVAWNSRNMYININSQIIDTHEEIRLSKKFNSSTDMHVLMDIQLNTENFILFIFMKFYQKYLYYEGKMKL